MVAAALAEEERQAVGSSDMKHNLSKIVKSHSVVLNYIGSILVIFAFIALVPILFSVIYKDGSDVSLAFLLTSIISLGTGIFLRLVFRGDVPNNVQATFITALGWVIISAVAAVPYVFVLHSSYLDAYFEAMSGFTTTGITMFTGLDYMPKGIIFWRSLTQWIGGLGIITFFLVVHSHGGSAHKIFGAESHKITSERPVPGLANTVKLLWMIYSGYTVLIFVMLLFAGSGFWDSLNHTLTALSTGGFSPHDASIAYYSEHGFEHYKMIEYVLIFGMFLGGTNFLVHYRILQKNIKALWDNTEMRYWFGIIFGFTFIILLERYLHGKIDIASPHFLSKTEENFRTVLFQVVSVITTTGYGTKDLFNPFFGAAARQLFLVMMIIGGCVGSTGGGIKVMRVAILFKLIKREIYKIFVPSKAVNYILIDHTPFDMEEVYRVSGLFFIWMVLLIAGGLITSFASKMTALESMSGMYSALGNIGPTFFSVKDMISLKPIVKITYILGMLMGRLEILPVLLLFSPKAWKVY